MSESTLSCPTCDRHAIVKNGKTRHNQQNYKCNDCGRQFVKNPKWRRISEETKQLIDRLLLEKIPLAGIARALEISERSARGADRRKTTGKAFALRATKLCKPKI